MNWPLLVVIIVSAFIGYLLGSINTSLLVGKVFFKTDIREHGSGNAGATNTLRVLGKGSAIAVLIGDFLKGIIACLIGRYLFGELIAGNGVYLGQYIAGFFAVIGHNWPVFFGFKGGKGVMTTFAVILVFSPLAALVCLVVFIIIVAITRYVSLGSMLAATLFIIIAIILNEPLPLILIGGTLVALIIIRHSENIKRLVSGNEKKISFNTNKGKE